MSLPSWARPGIKVVCIKTVDWKSIRTGERPSRGPEEKGIYEIVKAALARNGNWGLVLKEFPRASWKIQAFKPLIEQDLEFFRAIV